MHAKNYIEVTTISNASGSGWVATHGAADENSYRGTFFDSKADAITRARRMQADVKRAEGVEYEIRVLENGQVTSA